MRITKDAFNKISLNCPFRSRKLSTVHVSTNKVLKFHTCRALDMEPGKLDWDACKLKNCGIVYWADALVNIEDDK